MKNSIILTAISLVALATVTLTAGEALLSPRAKDAQVAIGASVTKEANLATANRGALGSPRAVDSQVVVGTGSEAVIAGGKCATVGTPRQAGMFASCCTVAKASCATAKACCAK